MLGSPPPMLTSKLQHLAVKISGDLFGVGRQKAAKNQGILLKGPYTASLTHRHSLWSRAEEQ